MKEPEFIFGDKVSVNGIGKYEIAEFDEHGDGQCDCCPKAHSYFMYRLKGFMGWYNEDQLQLYIGN